MLTSKNRPIFGIFWMSMLARTWQEPIFAHEGKKTQASFSLDWFLAEETGNQSVSFICLWLGSWRAGKDTSMVSPVLCIHSCTPSSTSPHSREIIMGSKSAPHNRSYDLTVVNCCSVFSKSNHISCPYCWSGYSGSKFTYSLRVRDLRGTLHMLLLPTLIFARASRWRSACFTT